MNKITELIFIGNQLDAQIISNNCGLGERASFRALLNVARLQNYTCSIDYFKIPLRQSSLPANELLFVSAYYCLDYCMQKGWQTLVSCHAGRVRSPSVVALWFAATNKVSIHDAFQYIKAKRPCAELRESYVKVLEKALCRIGRMP
jgi:protein-tyrosine phosphatase